MRTEPETLAVPPNTRNGAVVRWPQRVKAKGEIRAQFHHAIDMAPTVLEAAGLPQPTMVNGV